MYRIDMLIPAKTLLTLSDLAFRRDAHFKLNYKQVNMFYLYLYSKGTQVAIFA